ncbi:MULTISPECIES: ABC transporter substrate-binding protein [Pseudomonas]|uniref:ABC transporter substrate-binding protein n=1 Tax=Pseudomonas TaxID=286 RepID=UPI00249C9F8A|nr:MULTISPECIES: ABC transporter substrate-binding protein [Pseudomonas]
MPTRHYKGITWDHPRGYNALAASASLDLPEGFSIEWDKHPLEGFESHPIEDLAERYDLIVLDHPHVGEGVRSGALTPLDGLFDAAQCALFANRSIGASYASYAYAGHQWALPLDAATQVQAYRAELLDGVPPASWDAVQALAERAPVALSLAGPHAFLSFCSIAVAFGEAPTSIDPERFLGEETARRVLELMQRLYRSAPEHSRMLNPIGLLENMASTDDVALCPLVYGYVNYAAAQPAPRKSVSFADAPLAFAGGLRGSTLGGTGLAISRRCEADANLLAYLSELMSPGVQRTFIPAHDGQPSLREAWTDPAVNARWGNFYRDTARTLETAWVRPRYDGFIAFQSKASAVLREALAEREAPATTLERIQTLFHASRKPGAEN